MRPEGGEPYFQNPQVHNRPLTEACPPTSRRRLLLHGMFVATLCEAAHRSRVPHGGYIGQGGEAEKCNRNPNATTQNCDLTTRRAQPKPSLTHTTPTLIAHEDNITTHWANVVAGRVSSCDAERKPGPTQQHCRSRPAQIKPKTSRAKEPSFWNGRAEGSMQLRSAPELDDVRQRIGCICVRHITSTTALSNLYLGSPRPMVASLRPVALRPDARTVATIE